MRPNAFALAFTLAATALLALSGGAARAQYLPLAPDQAVGRQSDYRPGRAGYLLRGPVRSVREDDFNLHADGTKVFTGNMTMHFDERGRLARVMQGNGQMEDLYDCRFSHRDDGRVAAQECFFNRRPASRAVYVYADARRAVETLTYDPDDGTLLMRRAHFFDERGGETRSETEFVAAKGADAPARQVREMAHVYDERGGLVTTTVKGNAGGPEILVSHRSEPGGRQVTTIKYLEGAKETTVTTVTTQDERGEALSTESYGADGKLKSRVTYERKYDARGNWVEEVIRSREHADPHPRESSFLRRRTITYF